MSAFIEVSKALRSLGVSIRYIQHRSPRHGRPKSRYWLDGGPFYTEVHTHEDIRRPHGDSVLGIDGLWNAEREAQFFWGKKK